MDITDQFKKRKSPRIPNFDYSHNNYYFVTICTNKKKCIFGSIEKLSTFGEIAKQELLEIPKHYDGVEIAQSIVMPNHIHMILILENGPALDKIIGSYKSGVSRKIHKYASGIQVWQRSFHDHIIRNPVSYEKISNYVRFNHLKWKEDCFYIEIEY